MTLPVQRRATKVSTSLVTISFKERCILHQSAAAVNMTELLHFSPHRDINDCHCSGRKPTDLKGQLHQFTLRNCGGRAAVRSSVLSRRKLSCEMTPL